MDNSQIPDVHSPDFPNTSVLKWTPDGPTVLANMDRATVTTYTSYLAYTHTYGPHVDRLGDPVANTSGSSPPRERPSRWNSEPSTSTR